jgi:alpha-1,2-mannosyltransferase
LADRIRACLRVRIESTGARMNSDPEAARGAVARLAGNSDPDYRWWAIVALLVGLAGITVAAWAHRRGRRLAGVTCCAITGLLISPFSWTHHWVWAEPLLVALAATAWRRRSAACGLAVLAGTALALIRERAQTARRLDTAARRLPSGHAS